MNVIVTDAGANILAATKNKFGEKRQLVCTDHKLSRMRTVAIEKCPAFKEILSKIRLIVSFFKKSINAADELRALQLREGKSEGDILKVKKDEPTRWGSTFTMLERFITLADFISIVLLHHTNVQMLTGSDLATAKEGCEILGNVAAVITELEAEKYSVAGKVIPLLTIMKKVCSS